VWTTTFPVLLGALRPHLHPRTQKRGLSAHSTAGRDRSGRYTRDQVETMLFREGGLYSYLGTRDLVEVERRIAWGDAQAKEVFEGMI